MHFIASATHALMKQCVAQLYPWLFPLDVTTDFRKLSRETNKLIGFCLVFSLWDNTLLHFQHVAGPANIVL